MFFYFTRGEVKLLQKAREHYQTRANYKVKINPQAVDLIFAFSFGQGENQSPGATNEGLATMLAEFLVKAKEEVRIFAQWEIAQVLTQKHQIQVEYSAKLMPNQDYLSTLEVIKQLKAQLAQEWMNPDLTILLIAQADHAFRVEWMLQQEKIQGKLLLSSVQPHQGWGTFGCQNYGYWAESTQSWTRDRESFIKNETRFYKR